LSLYRSRITILFNTLSSQILAFIRSMTDELEGRPWIKVVIVGNSGVGKTVLGTRLAGDDYFDNHAPTIGATYLSVTIEKDGTEYGFHVWDTAGSEQYQSFSKAFWRGSNLIILCYSVDSRSSFESIAKWKKTADEELPDIPIILVATKADTFQDAPEFVSEAEGVAEAGRLKATHVTTSAKEGTGLGVLGEEMVKATEGMKIDRPEAPVPVPASGQGCC
jgi:small GTP-binding protein